MVSVEKEKRIFNNKISANLCRPNYLYYICSDNLCHITKFFKYFPKIFKALLINKPVKI